MAPKGSGRAVIDGAALGFVPDSTLIVPPKVVHQLVNSGGEPMLLIAPLSASSARDFAPDGAELPAPGID